MNIARKTEDKILYICSFNEDVHFDNNADGFHNNADDFDNIETDFDTIETDFDDENTELDADDDCLRINSACKWVLEVKLYLNVSRALSLSLSLSLSHIVDDAISMQIPFGNMLLYVAACDEYPVQ